MNSCYYCKDYNVDKNWCDLFDKSASDMEENCDHFVFHSASAMSRALQ